MFRITVATAAAIVIGTPAAAMQAQGPAAAPAPTARADVICQNVVSAERGAKPYELCLTKAEWEAKKQADAKDPNRVVCRYQEASNSRFKSYKVCMSAAEWENQRQLERQAVERIQSGTCVRGAGC